MNDQEDWTTAAGPQKIIKKPIGFFSSYESRQESNKKSKPSKIAQITFLKKIRHMRKKIKYLTEAQQSQEQRLKLHKKYCSSGDSQTPISQQLFKRNSSVCANPSGQMFRKLLKVDEQNHENQFNEENEVCGSEIKSVTRYFQQANKNDSEKDNSLNS